jgi:hypothetical protein
MTLETQDLVRVRKIGPRRSGDRFMMMMSRHREFLQKQRGFLQEKLTFVEDELRSIEAFLGRSAEGHGLGSEGGDPGLAGRRSDQRTIKSYIFDYLAVEQEGLMTGEVLERIHADGRTDYDLLHLRAYLYRLANLGYLARSGKRWQLAPGFDRALAEGARAAQISETI